MSAGPYPTKPMFEALKGRVATLEGQGDNTLPPIYLSAGGTPSFEPTQRLSQFLSGGERVMGPVLPAGTYSKMVIPLRYVQGGEAVSAALVRVSDSMVLHLIGGTLTPNQAEWVIEGPWTVESETAFVVGTSSGDWDAHIAAWYGGGEGYEDYPHVKTWASFFVLPPSGSVASAKSVEPGSQRTVLVYGAENEKSTQNPLDPVDFPVSTVANAPKNSGFVTVDDAAKTASLCWKFSDGTVRGVPLSALLLGTPGTKITALVHDRTALAVFFTLPAGIDVDVALYNWTVTVAGQSDPLMTVESAGMKDGRPSYKGTPLSFALSGFSVGDIAVTGVAK